MTDHRDSSDGDGLDALAVAVAEAATTTVLTGAGVSAASGIPTFRGEDGVWGDAFDPADFRFGRFQRDPEGFWRDRLALHEQLFPEEVAPNAAHEALVRLEGFGAVDAVVTQNTDGLHADAGTERLVELHGNARRVVCRDCGERADAGPVFDRVRAGETPPRCACGGVYKPDVVLFGERLPDAAITEARELAAESDVFLVAGSSLSVDPAASFPLRAARDGTLAICNLDETAHDGVADFRFEADVTGFLPDLADRVRARRSSP